MLKICKEQCGEDTACPYETCPFLHKYTYEGEVVSGYKFVGSPEDPDCSNCKHSILTNSIGILYCQLLKSYESEENKCSKWKQREDQE